MKFKESFSKAKACVKTGFKDCFTFARENKKTTILIVITVIMVFTLVVTIASL